MDNEPKKPDKEYKVAAIYGSPRKGGNTSLLLDSFIEGVNEAGISQGRIIKVDRIYSGRLNISPCRECNNCSRTGRCIIDDDMQRIYKILAAADFIAVSTPIFFTTVSAYLKAIIDRCQRFWVLKYELKKDVIGRRRRGIMISAAGSSYKSIFDCPRKAIRAFFDVLYIDYIGDFVFNDIDKKGDILKNKSALQDVFTFGREEILKPGKQ